MSKLLKHNMRAAFNEGKSDLIANILIDRSLIGDYSGTRDTGPKGEGDQQIIGTMFLFVADENTYLLAPEAEAFVMYMEHEARLVDYLAFPDIDSARVHMTINSAEVTAVNDVSGLRSNN